MSKSDFEDFSYERQIEGPICRICYKNSERVHRFQSMDRQAEGDPLPPGSSAKVSRRVSIDREDPGLQGGGTRDDRGVDPLKILKSRAGTLCTRF